MSELLEFGGYLDWSNALNALNGQLESAPEKTCAALVRMFGGMGSLNDLVLYKDGAPLREENDELDNLRSKLYLSCKS